MVTAVYNVCKILLNLCIGFTVVFRCTFCVTFFYLRKLWENKKKPKNVTRIKNVKKRFYTSMLSAKAVTRNLFGGGSVSLSLKYIMTRLNVQHSQKYSKSELQAFVVSVFFRG